MAKKEIILSDKIARGWLTQLDAYGNPLTESQYIEFKIPKNGHIAPGLIVYFRGKKLKLNKKGEVMDVDVEPDDFYKGGLYYVNVPGVEDYYFCFETNEHIKKAKATHDEVYATPFACVG